MANTAALWMLPCTADHDETETRGARYERIALLFAAWRQGDTSAFETLVAELHPTAYRVAWRLLGNAADAEDAVQETFWRVWQRAGTYQPEQGAFTSWLFRMARRLAMDTDRRQK